MANTAQSKKRARQNERRAAVNNRGGRVSEHFYEKLKKQYQVVIRKQLVLRLQRFSLN